MQGACQGGVRAALPPRSGTTAWRSGRPAGPGLVRGIVRRWSGLAGGLGEFLQALLLLLLLMLLLLGQLALAFLE
jgi:hypothetical protein